jgi:hypothetical protein
VNKARYQAGRIPAKDYFQCAANRLDAEIMFARTRMRADSEFPPGEGIGLGHPDLAKELAKAKRAASQIDVDQNKRKKLEFLEWAFGSRFREFLAGRGTLDILQEVSRLWLGAELDLATDQTARIAALERHWEATRVIEYVNNNRHDAGRIPIQDYQQSVAARIDAEKHLRQASSGRGAAQAWMGGSNMMEYMFAYEKYDSWPWVPWMARQKFAAVRRDINRLPQERLTAQQVEFEARLSEFELGRGTLDILLEAIDDLAAAERAAGRPEVQVLENLWQHNLPVKLINDKRYSAGRIPIQDTLQTTYCEARARLELVRLQSRTKH